MSGKSQRPGIHTEMLSDGVINLIKDDIVNNKYKGFHDNVSITSFCFGTKTSMTL